MFFSKELSTFTIKNKKNPFLLVLSISQGWGIVKLINNQISTNNSFKTFFYSKVYSCFFSNVILGLFKNYYYYLKLKGMGFKSLVHIKGLVLKLGYSHRILFSIKKEISFIYLTRQSMILKSRNIATLKDAMFYLTTLKKKSVYKKKGVFLKGSIVKIKLTSKKSKF